MCRLKPLLLCDQCGCKNQAMMLEEKMGKTTVILIIVVVLMFVAASFTLGYNTAMDKAEKMTQACFAGEAPACNWWKAKIQKSAAEQQMREIEKSLAPQPTEVQ
jgi:flagellar basal body-associated protein FliL